MKRFPLYAKILLWFFLNLLALAAGSYFLLRVQFRVGPELLLLGRAGERLQSIAEIIRDGLNTRPQADWNEMLESFSKGYKTRFMVYRNDGVSLAGIPMPLPQPVLRRLTERPAAGRGPAEQERGGLRPERRGEERPRLREGNDLAPRRGALQNRPPFLVRTDNPGGYWIGVRLPPQEPNNPGAGPATLLIFSESLRAGGLLLDYSSWLWGGAAAVAFSVLFWLPLVRGITRSVGQMTAATAQIAEGKFDVRVDDRRRDELGQLGAGINQMAGRLSGLVSGQKRFLGDTAHELCSPIARMQMAVGILEERAGEREHPYVEDLREEVQHISNLVNELLSFSKASLGAPNLKLQSALLRPLIDKAVRREEQAGVGITVEAEEALAVIADPELIVRALANLLRNAVRYAGHAGPIHIAARRVGGAVEISVADNGPGAPEEDLTKLFDPFYRVDASRNRDTGGAGLGLSIVKTCVESCGGTVLCRNRQPKGFEVVMRLQTAG